MNYSAMPRCGRFFVSPRREEGAVFSRQAMPDGRKRGTTRRARVLWAVCGVAGSFARNRGTNMPVGRALLSIAKPSCATCLGLSTGF